MHRTQVRPRMSFYQDNTFFHFKGPAMPANQDPSFLVRAVFWILSMFGKAERLSAEARDARLKRYGTRLIWKDDKALGPLTVGFSTVYAESEQQARELTQAQAIKEHPLVTSPLSDKTVMPPYMTDPARTLPLWEVGEIALDDDERERASTGQLGPARALFMNSSGVLA